MSENKMLIDAAHPEETRVVVLRAGRVEEFDYESAARKQLRGNIYLAKVTRVEPALQAAFIDYGGNRHGFLAFNEVHPDYYQIPMADRLALLEEEAAAEAEEEEEVELAVSEEEASEDADDDGVEDDPDDDESDDDEAEDDEDDDEDDDVEDEGPYDVHSRSDDDDAESDDEDDDEDGGEEASDDDNGNEPGAAEIAADSPSEVDAPVQETAPEASADPQSGETGTQEPFAQSDDSQPDGGSASTDVPDAGEQSEASEDDSAQSRPVVLSEAMPRDASLSEAPLAGEPEKAGEVASESGEGSAEADTDSASETTSASSDPEDVEQRTDAATSAAQSDQPGYETSADDTAAEAKSADIDPEADNDTGETRSRGRRPGRPAGRRRRGGRSRRGRHRDSENDGDDDSDGVEQVGNEDALEELPARPRRSRRSYKIQEVVKRRQVLLIQVVKEERGNKGAALTTYLSLAGRYTVLMPNTARGGGISRKITNPQDRKRLKAIANELDVPDGMGLIIRTAGAARTKQEIRRDFEYLLRLWESVRELTLQSTAPALVYEEGDLIKRSIRDLYNKDVDEIVVSGDEAFRSAKNFMRMLMPSHAKNVIKYDDPEPLFTGYGIERQLNAMFSPYVHLPSGGYLVINQTEALVAIDVNSGRSTREFSIEETALNTNLEASDEIARQLKLRDLAGLIVIDYIDMEERRNNRNVERRIRDALKNDRARIQIGRISPFGLLEMSRQRLRTGVLEGSTTQCEHCQGTGIIRSVESVALGVLRGLEDAVMAGARTSLIATTTAEVALYILNNKRDFVVAMENRLGMPVVVQASAKMAGANYTVEKGEAVAPVARHAAKADAVSVDWGFDAGEDGAEEIAADRSETGAEPARADDEGEDRDRPRRRRRRRGGRRTGEETSQEPSEAGEQSDEADDDADNDGEVSETARSDDTESGEEKSGRRRRRGRRGGRRNRGRSRDGEGNEYRQDASKDAGAAEDGAEQDEPAASEGEEADRADRALDREPLAANDDQPDGDKGETRKEPFTTRPLVTPIEIGMGEPDRSQEPKPDPAAEEAPADSMLVDEPAADQTATAFTIATTPMGEGDDTKTTAATEAEEASPAARRQRGEPVSSEPRVARITVTPDGAEASDATSPTSEPADATESADKPTRRGWWQRKLLGDA